MHKDYDYHVPIMLDECMDALNIKSGGLYFDGTLGGGGHSSEILRRGGNLIATDLDSDAINHFNDKYSKEFVGRYTLVKSNFKQIKNILTDLNIESLDGAMLDLGVSSHQIDEKSRGFSYMGDGALDMRMNQDAKFSAYDVVNDYEESELSRIFYVYGEDQNARRVAKRIVEQRQKSPIRTTAQLSDLIASVSGMGYKKGKKLPHPAKKIFQAIRIEVNNELEGLDTALTDIISSLSKGARLAVIAFHSLEDRIVKQTFKLLNTDCICDKSLPVCVCNHKREVKLITPKGVRPTKSEQETNKRSTSAILRIAEKL